MNRTKQNQTSIINNMMFDRKLKKTYNSVRFTRACLRAGRVPQSDRKHYKSYKPDQTLKVTLSS